MKLFHKSNSDSREALRLLNKAGYGGDDLVEGVQQLCEQLQPAHADPGTVPAPGSDFIVTYFVSYVVQHQEFHNGGRQLLDYGNTAVHVPGGIDRWEKVQAVTQFIGGNAPEVASLINPKVIILSLYEMSETETSVQKG